MTPMILVVILNACTGCKPAMSMHDFDDMQSCQAARQIIINEMEKATAPYSTKTIGLCLPKRSKPAWKVDK